MSETAQQSLAYAVIGYVSDEVAKSLGTQGHGKPIEVRIERGSDHEVVRIPAEAVSCILHGASEGGETGVQVLLKDDGKVETLTRSVAKELFLRRIPDASINFPRLPINVIYADPFRLAEIAKERPAKA